MEKKGLYGKDNTAWKRNDCMEQKRLYGTEKTVW